MNNYKYKNNFIERITINSPSNFEKTSKGYDVYITDNFFHLSDALKKLGDLSNKNICIVTDSKVESLFYSEVFLAFSKYSKKIFSVVVEAKEENKSIDNATVIYNTLIDNNFNRDDYLVALGGGIIGDLTGFCASNYKRGIRFIQIPTTLLAQVDASLGGKNAVNVFSYKNMVGSYYQPEMVYSNISTIKELPDEEINNGLAEVIKSALIADKSFYDYLKKQSRNYTLDFLVNIVINTILIKRYFIEIDPFEKKERALLNFGHTSAHAIEKCTVYKTSHGNAVALGMVISLTISRNLNLISFDDYYDIMGVFEKFDLPTKTYLSNDTLDEFRKGIKADKKNLSHGLKYIIIDKIGHGVVVDTVSPEDIFSAAQWVLK